MARHESLRTSFEILDSEPIQVVTPPRPFTLAMADIEGVGAGARDAELRRVILEEVRAPFDLARDLMLRGLVVRLGPREHVLLLVAHHIAADGWSAGILYRELAEFYRAAVAGQEPSLPSLAVQYPDYALWQRRHLQGEALQSQLKFWDDTWRAPRAPWNCPPIGAAVAADVPGRPDVVSVPEDIAGGLKDLGRRENATLFMTLLAAYQVLLLRYSGQADLVVGSPIAGRDRTELEGLIGFFVNTLPLRTDLSGDPTFRQLLGRVRDSTLEVFGHKELPFTKLVEELKAGRMTGAVARVPGPVRPAEPGGVDGRIARA